jgi:hypothetical protein
MFIGNLKKAQRIWIQFRDAQVAMRYPQYTNSSSFACSAKYLAKLTDERTATLQLWLDGVEDTNACPGSVMYKSKLKTRPKTREFQLFQNKALGLEFEYRDADDFDDRKELSISSTKWRDTALFAGTVHLKLPSGFYAKKETFSRSWYCQSCNNALIGDSKIVIMHSGSENSERPQAVGLYFVRGDLRQIAINEGFVLLDTTGQELDFKDSDSTAVNLAIKNDNWASLGRQGMTEVATVLRGIAWQGLRGSNFTGYYDEKGYSGLQRCSSAFLIRKFTEECFLVCSYSDSQMEENKLGESDFYDIVAKIDIRN